MEQRDQRLVSQWLDAVNGPSCADDGARERARAAMGAAGVEKVFALLVARLGESDSESRCQTLRALVLLDGHRAVETLIAMLNDPSEVVRWYACGCLHDVGTEQAVPALIEVLRRDSDPQVRGTAAYALGGIGSPEAIPALLAALDTDNEYDELGHSPSSCAATALDDILGTDETRLRVSGSLCRLRPGQPDHQLLRRLAQERYQQWSSRHAEPPTS